MIAKSRSIAAFTAVLATTTGIGARFALSGMCYASWVCMSATGMSSSWTEAHAATIPSRQHPLGKRVKGVLYHIDIQSQQLISLHPDRRTAIILYANGWSHPSSDLAQAIVSVSPKPKRPLAVNWQSSSKTVVLDWPRFQPPPTPPANGTLIYAAGVGIATLSATVRDIADGKVSVPIYAYDSVSIGCDLRSTSAFAFDHVAKSSADADIFVTSPLISNLECGGIPTPDAYRSFELQFPGGGTIIPGGLAEFTSVTASQWTNSTTAVPIVDPGILLFKTRTGRVVKMIDAGPYEVSNQDGRFPF